MSRIPYNRDPDFTKPLLEIPGETCQRMLSRLGFLYGHEVAGEWMPELERILKVHHTHKPRELIEAEQGHDPTERFTQRDMVLITYGDSIQGEQKNLSVSPSVFTILRVSPEGDRRLLTLTNVTDGPVRTEVPADSLGVREDRWCDLVSGRGLEEADGQLPIDLDPYAVMWVSPESQLQEDV